MEERIYDFKTSNELGKIAEEITEKYLDQSNKVKSYINVTKNKKYQNKDIDFIVKTNKQKIITIESKADQWDTSNIFFETISNIENHQNHMLYY